jgi:hypothetical protein
MGRNFSFLEFIEIKIVVEMQDETFGPAFFIFQKIVHFNFKLNYD